jgi:hypothetical protein
MRVIPNILSYIYERMTGGGKKAMKAISIKLEVPEWIDEEKFGARLKRIAEKMASYSVGG